MNPKIAKLAKILTQYSVEVKSNDKVIISCSPKGLVLAKVIYRLCLQVGAFPHLLFAPENLDWLFFNSAQPKHLTKKPEVGLFLANWADKFIRIVTNLNDRQLAQIKAQKIMTYTKSREPIKNIMLKKPWVLTYYPTQSMAQTAGLSLEELEKIYFQACLQDWSKMKQRLSKLKKRFDQVDQVTILGKHNRLTFSLKGRLAQAAAGKYNMPDGEVFAAPIDDSAEGEIFFDLPSLYQGKIVERVRLTFKKGRVIKATADRGQKFLDKALATDAGARRLGEFAIGTNYGIKQAMLNTLFDEKIGGTIHLALGNAYLDKEGGGTNKSAIHWDLVKDMRQPNAKVLFDGKPVLVNGKILV
ncbi:aminopeptidase [Patescibacteria group bacterium]|nr:aminopeptidase [Patescibacteria group bacterium]